MTAALLFMVVFASAFAGHETARALVNARAARTTTRSTQQKDSIANV